MALCGAMVGGGVGHGSCNAGQTSKDRRAGAVECWPVTWGGCVSWLQGHLGACVELEHGPGGEM